jgi:hypothetical protein
VRQEWLLARICKEMHGQENIKWIRNLEKKMSQFSWLLSL